MKLPPKITLSDFSNWSQEVIECDLEASDTPIGIRSFRIRWGRDQYLDDHKPATCDFTFVVFDKAEETTTKFFFGGDQMGITVQAGNEVIFRGYPRSVRARRDTLNGRDVYIFDVTAVDETAKLTAANPIGPGIQSWSSTRGDSGRDTINTMFKTFYNNMVNRMQIKSIGNVPNLRKYSVQIGHTDWSGITMDKYLSLFYRSFGGYTWDYNPSTKQIFYVSPGPSNLTTYLKWHLDGVYVTPRVNNSESIGIVDLDGKELEVDQLGFEISPRMTLKDVIIKAYDHAQSKQIEHKVSLHNWGTDSTTVDTMLAPRDRAQAQNFAREFSRDFDTVYTAATLWPEIPPVTYRFTELPSSTYVRYWLGAYQSSIWGVIRNSAILDWLQGTTMRYPARMVPPTVAPKGGTIEYDGDAQEWVVTHELSIVGNFDKSIRSVTYETLNEGAATMGDYAARATWADFQMLNQNNELRS